MTIRTTTRHGRSRLVALALATLVASSGVEAMTAAPASALGYFCPAVTPPLTIALNAYPARCMHVYHTHYTIVIFDDDATLVNKCAVVKPNSDGSGGDVGAPAACAPGNEQAYWTVGGAGVGGYATGINNSSNYHTGFFGYISYN